MRTMAMLGTVLGFIFAVLAVFMPSAPQQAAWAALACAVCVVPYVGWRTTQLDDADRENRKFRTEVLALMKERPPTQ